MEICGKADIALDNKLGFSKRRANEASE